jgi:hypothetical protein
MSIKTDNTELYEHIGDIVIQKAHSGDKDCLRIFELAMKKTAEKQEKSTK